MNILVFNCGSSSLNYKIFSPGTAGDLVVVCQGKAHRVGVKGSQPSFIEHHLQEETFKVTLPIPDHHTAANLVLDFIADRHLVVDGIGHRFVHGGSIFQESVRLDEETQAALQACLPLAPIHNPNSMSVIEVCLKRMSDLPQYLTFDTAFHASLPESAYRYALPEQLCKKMGIRKYGFHGLSYQFVTTQAAWYLEKPLEQLNLVACHLGTGGSSAVAIREGKSIDTSMGFSPLAGLMMSTRTGDLDPLIPIFLMEDLRISAKEITTVFNKKSGLLGVSGLSSDIRDLIHAAQENEAASQAVELYTYRLKKMIAAYVLLLGKVDGLIFTDDVGVQNPLVRSRACAGMSWCGITLDEVANLEAPWDQIAEISPPGAPVRVLSIPTDEERVIGLEGYRLLEEVSDVNH